jgi:hypothetical protein
VAVDGSGDVFVADTGNHAVKEVRPDGSIKTIGSGFLSPRGVAVDGSGDVFVADLGVFRDKGDVEEVLPDGTTKTIGSGFNPTGVAVDAAGDVFVADFGNNAVEEFLPDGAIQTIGSGFSPPEEVAVDAAGDVFVTDSGNNAVEEVLPDHTTIKTLGSGFNHPFGVAVDAAGDVFVGDSRNNRVVELSPPTVAATPAPLTGSTATPVSATLTGLSPGTTYYYRAVAGAFPDPQSPPLSFSLVKQSQTITFSPPSPVTYGAAAITLSDYASGGASNNPVTFSIDAKSTAGAGSISGDVLTVTGVGNIIIDANQAGNAHYAAAAQVQGTVEVKKADASFSSVSGYHVTYDGNSHTATGSATGVNGESLAGLDLSGTTRTNATNGAVSDGWTFTDTTGNYNNASGSVSDQIDKAAAVIVLTGYSATYDGNAHTAGGTATGVKGEDLSAGLNLSGTTHTNAGTYNGDAWSFAGGTNYNDASGTVNDSIAKANATVVVTPYSVTYDGQAHTAVTSITGVNGETGATVGIVDVSNTTHTNAGTYASDSWSFAGTNYNNASGTITDTINQPPLTVNPASPTPTTPPSPILLEVMDSRLWVLSTQTGQVLLSAPLSFGDWRVVKWEIVPGIDGLPNVIFTLQNKHHPKQMRRVQADGSVLLRLVQQLEGLPRGSVVVARLGGDGLLQFIVGTERGHRPGRCARAGGERSGAGDHRPRCPHAAVAVDRGAWGGRG